MPGIAQCVDLFLQGKWQVVQADTLLDELLKALCLAMNFGSSLGNIAGCSVAGKVDDEELQGGIEDRDIAFDESEE